MEQENPQSRRKPTDDVRGSDQLRDPSGQRDLDRRLELRVLGSDVGFEETQGEKVAIAGTPAGLAEEEMKEGFVLKQARGWIKKGHGPAPFLPCAESCIDGPLGGYRGEDVA